MPISWLMGLPWGTRQINGEIPNSSDLRLTNVRRDPDSNNARQNEVGTPAHGRGDRRKTRATEGPESLERRGLRGVALERLHQRREGPERLLAR